MTHVTVLMWLTYSRPRAAAPGFKFQLQFKFAKLTPGPATPYLNGTQLPLHDKKSVEWIWVWFVQHPQMLPSRQTQDESSREYAQLLLAMGGRQLLLVVDDAWHVFFGKLILIVLKLRKRACASPWSRFPSNLTDSDSSATVPKLKQRPWTRVCIVSWYYHLIGIFIFKLEDIFGQYLKYKMSSESNGSLFRSQIAVITPEAEGYCHG